MKVYTTSKFFGGQSIICFSLYQ